MADLRENRSFWTLARRFLKRVLPFQTVLTYLGTLAKAAIRGDVGTVYTIIEIQRMDDQPKLYIGPLLKTIRWLKQMNKLHKQHFGDRFDLSYRILSMGSDKDSLMNAQTRPVTEMEDPRRIMLQWRTAHRHTSAYSQRTQKGDAPDPGEDPEFDDFIVHLKRRRKIRSARNPSDRRRAWRMFTTMKTRKEMYHQQRHRRSQMPPRDTGADYEYETAEEEPETASSGDPFDEYDF